MEPHTERHRNNYPMLKHRSPQQQFSKKVKQIDVSFSLSLVRGMKPKSTATFLFLIAVRVDTYRAFVA